MASSDGDDVVDPAMERVRRKLVRLLLVSSGVMVLGFAAVLIAVIYRVSGDRATSPAPQLDVAASEIVSASAADGNLVLVLSGASPRVEVRRLSDGTLVQTFPLAAR